MANASPRSQTCRGLPPQSGSPCFVSCQFCESSLIEEDWELEYCVIHSGSPTIPPEQDITIGDNVLFGHGAVSNGRKFGSNILIGMNATILHDVEIGDYTVIAAGTVIKEQSRIPSRSFVAGVPGKIKAG